MHFVGLYCINIVNFLSCTFVIGGLFKMEKSKFQCSNIRNDFYTYEDAIEANTVLHSLSFFQI